MPKVAFQKLLCPTDFSPASDYGICCALSLAGVTGPGAQVHIINVVEQPGMEGSKLARLKWREAEERLKAFVEQRLGPLQAETGSTHVEITTELLPGDPVEVVTDYCARRTFDAVIIATRGKTGLERIMVGSVTAELIQKCVCPVMVVRQPPAADTVPPAST